jgi:crossover junction endodeoxyribonuclease RusA
VNRYWRHPNSGPLAGRTLISQEGRQYRKLVGDCVAWARSPSVGAQHVKVDIEACMPDRRKRDLDNLPKALFDALTHAGLWHDDGQVDDYRVWRSPVMGGRVIVRVELLEVPA